MLELLFHKVAKSDSTSATRNEGILQRVTSEFLQRATFATIKERIWQREGSDFLQRLLQQVTSEFYNE